MYSFISSKLRKLVKKTLDDSYITYQNHADRNVTPFLKSVLKTQPFHPKLLLEVALFRINKHKYIINKRDIFNSLVALEQNNKQDFLNSASKTLADLFTSTTFDKPVGDVINSTVLADLKSGLFINPFTNQPIELSILTDTSNQCMRYSTKYLFVGEHDLSKVTINEAGVTEIADLMQLSKDFANRDAIVKEFTIYHELSHDSHFQNYRLYKDSIRMGVDVPKKTKMLQEIEADLSSILYVIKDRKLNIIDAFELINGVVTFRCSVNNKTVWDSSIKCLTEETVHYHVTQPALLVLTRMINDEGVGFIHQMSCLDITNIAYHIADIVDDDFYSHNYKALLPEDREVFKYYLLDTSNEQLMCFYLLSYYGADIIAYNNATLEVRQDKFLEMADQLVEKVYSTDERVVDNTLLFRTLVAFQYTLNISPEKLQGLYLCKETQVLSSSVYDNFLERLVFDKHIDVEHTRNTINISIKEKSL
jgi:hypothetical protein